MIGKKVQTIEMVKDSKGDIYVILKSMGSQGGFSTVHLKVDGEGMPKQYLKDQEKEEKDRAKKVAEIKKENAIQMEINEEMIKEQQKLAQEQADLMAEFRAKIEKKVRGK